MCRYSSISIVAIGGNDSSAVVSGSMKKLQDSILPFLLSIRCRICNEIVTLKRTIAGVIGYTVRPNFRSGGPYSLREYGPPPPPPPPPPGPNSLGNTVPWTEFPGCTKPINRTQFPRELSPPPPPPPPGPYSLVLNVFPTLACT